MSNVPVAIVTGGSRGIGAAITSALARDGMHVAAGYHSNKEAADALVKGLLAEGFSVSAHRVDVSLPEDCNRFVSEVVGLYGQVNCLVNNAGLNIDKTVRKMTVEEWHNVLRVNLSGAFYMTKAVLEHMVDRGFGRIINVSSVIGEIGNFGQANYAASKAGLFGFTKSLAREVAAKNITVNCVAPGFIDTDMLATVPEAVLAGIVERIPVKRLGRPEEVARLVRFLADEESGYITGSVIAVNGGLDM
jgi:acetoacetyl-CoA reductase